ncbi:MAG: DEAD/DEAH box helicase [Clostridia bacterium]|nr:DEAD/DEAH box helicase [Clostridia bacterium]
MDLVTLREKCGQEEYEAGRALYRRGGVRELLRTPLCLVYTVAGLSKHIKLYSDGMSDCSCPSAPWCRHTIAALTDAQRSGSLRALREAQAVARANKLFDAMEKGLPETTTVELEPELTFSGKAIYIGLRIGTKRMYVVRSIPEFIRKVRTGEPLELGKGFTFFPSWMRFGKQEQLLLDLLIRHCDTLENAHVPIRVDEARSLPIPSSTAIEVFSLLDGVRFRLTAFGSTVTQTGLSTDPLPLSFTISDHAHADSGEHRLRITAAFTGKVRPLTEDFSYALCDGVVTRVSPAQQAAAHVCMADHPDGRVSFQYESSQTQRVMGELSMWLARVGDLRFTPDLEGQLVRAPFHARVYLDRDGADVTARTEFLYGDIIINPFAPDPDRTDGTLLLRDAQSEQEIEDLMATSGFRIAGGRVYLHGQDEIYRFVTEGVQTLAEKAEVFFSKAFRALTPRRAQLSGKLRSMNNGQLQLIIEDNEEEIEELLPLMRALRDHASYFRFKDGTFLSLEDTDSWQQLAEAVCEAEETTGKADLEAYRAAYLEALIHANSLPVTVDDSVERAARLEIETPEPPLDCLHSYQVRGFNWLCALHYLHMGGILADDMGLGKTVQTIAALLYFVRTNKERKPSIIVSPTSLTYNWYSELKRFAPELKVLLLSGSQDARSDQIDCLIGSDAPDIVITSYPLIRRDIPLLQRVNFRFAVLDEAQQIKNAASVGAHAVKQLQAETRVALTGTPMENHAGELWSIFDFILPGYLPNAGAFHRRYGDGQNSDELIMRIRPFLMRRLKKDVLNELPDKLDTTMIAEMPAEQRQVYRAGMLRRRENVVRLLNERGLTGSRAEVLSAITELRQICCHPALCVPDYSGTSGKLELLVDLLRPAIQNGHRALVFSQFTRMLRLIESRLKQERISCLYLDGDTPASERIQLCDAFNTGTGSVFLLSLKAGGTGLNLTGADLVFHYDPWWNPAAEEQAVDRAHRIGQTRTVEVVRLVVHDSIEEQVVGMSRAKRMLFDKLITPGESMPTKLSEADLLRLFSSEEP